MKEKRGAAAVGCCLHGGQGVQGGEGSRGDAGDLVVVQRQQAHGAQARERTVVDAGDLVASQHSAKTNTETQKLKCLANKIFWFDLTVLRKA